MARTLHEGDWYRPREWARLEKRAARHQLMAECCLRVRFPLGSLALAVLLSAWLLKMLNTPLLGKDGRALAEFGSLCSLAVILVVLPRLERWNRAQSRRLLGEAAQLREQHAALQSAQRAPAPRPGVSKRPETKRAQKRLRDSLVRRG